MSLREMIAWGLFFVFALFLFIGGLTGDFQLHQMHEPGIKIISNLYRGTSNLLRSGRSLFVRQLGLVDQIEQLQSERRMLEQQLWQLQYELAGLVHQQRNFFPPVSATGRLVPVRSISHNLTGLERSVRIDAGREAGLKVGDPLFEITPDSWILRGKIYRLYSDHSLAILTDDPRFVVGVRIADQLDREFVMEGRGYQQLTINNYPEVLPAREGDRVYTARASSIAPPDVYIGRIVDRQSTGKALQTADVLRVEPPDFTSFPDFAWVLVDND